MQSSNNSRDGSKQDKQRRQWQHSRRQGRTCTVPTNRREATMDDIYKTGPELCNKGISTFLTTTNILGHEENEAYTTVSTRNKGLQVHTAPDDNSGRQRHTNTRRLRLCRLGRLHNNKEIHNRIRNQIPWSDNPFRIKNTSNRSTVKCGIGIILNRNRSTRSTTHPQFPNGDNTDKQITNSNPHGLNKRKEHCNKNRIVKESKTHWLEVPFHTAIGTQRHTISAQDRYLGQHCRHIHQICHGRNSQQAPVQRWACEPRQQLAQTVATVSQASKQTVSHPHQQARCVYNTYIRSWRHGITILYGYNIYYIILNFDNTSIYWMTVTMNVTISFVCMKFEQVGFHNFLLHKKCTRSEVFNNGWKETVFEWNNFCCMNRVFEYNFLFVSAAISKLKGSLCARVISALWWYQGLKPIMISEGGRHTGFLSAS